MRHEHVISLHIGHTPRPARASPWLRLVGFLHRLQHGPVLRNEKSSDIRGVIPALIIDPQEVACQLQQAFGEEAALVAWSMADEHALRGDDIATLKWRAVLEQIEDMRPARREVAVPSSIDGAAKMGRY